MSRRLQYMEIVQYARSVAGSMPATIALRQPYRDIGVRL